MYYLLMLLTSLLYAANFVAGKFLISHMGSLNITSLRWICAAIILVPIVWAKERKILPHKRSVSYLFVMGVTGVVLFNVFTYWALNHTSPDDVGLLSALNPISIALASLVFLRDKVKPIQVIGMLISLIGVIVVISRGSLHALLSFQFNIGDLFMIVAVITWGLYSVASKKALQYETPYMATLWSALIGAVITLPFDFHKNLIANPNAAFWTAFFFSVIGATVLATIFFNVGVQKLGATKSGMFLNFNPIFTSAIAFFLLGDRISLAQIIGTLLVISGVIWFTLTAKTRVQQNESVIQELRKGA